MLKDLSQIEFVALQIYTRIFEISKYCNVTADSKGRVNIKFKIIKRIYFFAKEANFLKSVNKLENIISRYLEERKSKAMRDYFLSED